MLEELEDELAYKERELALAKRTAEREKMRRHQAEERLKYGKVNESVDEPAVPRIKPKKKS